MEYVISHRTGIRKWDAGKRKGAYIFTLIGDEGSTSGSDCSADRRRGKIGTCSIKDKGELGNLEKMRIRNTSQDSWTIKTFTVKVDGKLVGKWTGSKTVPKFATVDIFF